MATMIEVQNLAKRYRLGGQDKYYSTLREQILRGLVWPFRRKARADDDHIWALRDVSFEVNEGEVVGIIGRNGAGKSTLLKILSRVTRPTEGRARLFGRSGSLLEVGTGFHAELTGRENIYLSGSILGMRRSEITKKFDEIVAFSEIQKFLDTPVKHYSSGMYVRLGFSIAAHLEPEILIVDEVLAVGDAAFQKKCLGKMSEVAKGGRTVLFVSHDMAAVGTLCQRLLLIDSGHMVVDGPPAEVIAKYLSGIHQTGTSGRLRTEGRTGNGRARVAAAEFRGVKSGPERVLMGEHAELVLDIESKEECKSVNLSFVVHSPMGVRLFNASTYRQNLEVVLGPGTSRWICRIGPLQLRPGLYRMDIGIAQEEPIDMLPDALVFEVLPDDVLGSGRILDGTGGTVYFPFVWECVGHPGGGG